jgi:hypothetical protein
VTNSPIAKVAASNYSASPKAATGRKYPSWITDNAKKRGATNDSQSSLNLNKDYKKKKF